MRKLLAKGHEPANLDVFILLQVCLLIKSAFLVKRTPIAERAGSNYCCCSLVTKSCPTLCDPMDCSPPAPLSMEFSGKNTEVGCLFLLQGIFPTQGSNPHLLHCRQIVYHWATWRQVRWQQMERTHSAPNKRHSGTQRGTWGLRRCPRFSVSAFWTSISAVFSFCISSKPEHFLLDSSAPIGNSWRSGSFLERRRGFPPKIGKMLKN